MSADRNISIPPSAVLERKYPLLAKFLGAARWKEFFGQLDSQSAAVKQPALGSSAVAVALIICSVPVLFTLIEAFGGAASFNSTIAFGICTVLALLIRHWLGLEYIPVNNLRLAMRTTHTAVALGCIPVLLIILYDPALLASRHDVLTSSVPAPGSAQHSPAAAYLMILFSALWIALTEEIMFRGLLVSVLRRWSLIGSQRRRDILAVGVSALLFGAAHYPAWGPAAAVALTGLGIGFVLGYIANGEKLLPLILYHFIFDTLSIAVAVFS